MADPYFANTSLLLPMNGANSGTIFTDWSYTPKSITRVNAVTSTAQSKYYGSSGYFNGSAYLRIDSTNVFNFGTDPFTIEAYIYILSPSTDAYPYLMASSVYNSGSGFYMGVDGAGTSWGGLGKLNFNGATTLQYGPAVLSTTIIRGTGWHHFAVVRSGVVTTLYIDGVLESTHTAVGTANYGSAGSPYIMTNYGNPSVDQQYGYMQDLRVTKNIARYTANFTPPSRLLASVSGVIRDTNSIPCARQVHVYKRSNGTLIGSIISNASTGTYEVFTGEGEVMRVVLADEPTLYCDVLDRIIPG